MNSVDWSKSEWQFREAKSAYDEVPSAAYYARFLGVSDKEVTPVPGQPPETKWRFEFAISKGEHAGKKPACLTNRKLSANTQAGQIVAGFAGRPLKAGDKIPEIIQEAVGKEWLVNVAPGPQGGKPQIRSVSQPPAM